MPPVPKITSKNTVNAAVTLLAASIKMKGNTGKRRRTVSAYTALMPNQPTGKKISKISLEECHRRARAFLSNGSASAIDVDALEEAAPRAIEGTAEEHTGPIGQESNSREGCERCDGIMWVPIK